MTCNFSNSHYKEILEIALKNNYNFINYFELIDKNQFQNKDEFSKEKICILRHDVDYTPEKIYDIAKIEYDLGIKSTFFFQTSAWTYNSRSKETYSVAKEIDSMGHQIGVHLDLSWNKNISVQEIATYFQKEKKLLGNILEVELVDIFSHHNPHKLRDFILNQITPSVRHTYEPMFFSKIKYLSDSQGWYEGCPCKIFESSKYSKIQLLTHPFIWDKNPETDFISDMAKMITKKTIEYYNYTTKYHPVCEHNKTKLKDQIIKKINEWK